MKATPDRAQGEQYRTQGEECPRDYSEDDTRSGELQTVFQSHNDVLIQYLQKILGSHGEAIDVAQEAYSKILGLDKGRVINHFKSYLFRTARNLAFNRVKQSIARRERQNLNLEEVEIPDEKPGAERIISTRQEIQILHDALYEMPAKCRIAFTMHKLEHYGYDEIASRLNVSESTARRYVFRALDFCQVRLRKIRDEG